MNVFTFLKLIKNIYGKAPADLNFIQRSGLLAVKIAQVHALRVDFLDEEKCRHLAKLYRQTDRVPPRDAKKLLEKNAPEALLKNLADFNQEPLASASIGQVHLAKLKSGEEVVIKLVKQDVAEQFRKDAKAVKRLFKWLTWFYPKLRGVANPLGLLGQIERSTISELDLKNEALGHKQLYEIWEKGKQTFDLENLRFCKIYEEYSNSWVLVSEYLSGPTFDEQIQKKNLAYPELIELFRLHGYFIFLMGIFHGDLHPGNIILHNNAFYFVDTGYIGTVEKKISQNLLLFFKALADYDYKTCAKYLENMSDVKLGDKEYKKYENNFFEIYKSYTNSTVSQVSLTKQMMLTIRLGVLSGMRFSEGIFDVIKSLMYMDGMVLRTNPNAKLVSDMKPLIKQFIQ